MNSLFLTILLIVWAAQCMGQPNYADSILTEQLGRGVAAVKADAGSVFVTWRYLESDERDVAFNVYRDGVKLNQRPITDCTYYIDYAPSSSEALYEVRPAHDNCPSPQGTCTLPAAAPIGYIDIPIDTPSGGTTPDGRPYTYTPGDASIGDVDADGEYEIILKWDPTNAHDNAHDGYTGNVLIDGYRLTGEKLWRIDLGPNIRAGAHYTQFMVYDLDGDHRAELVIRTSDGAVDGVGKVIGNPFADYRIAGDTASRTHTPAMQGRILGEPEYLTVFSGLTGEALYTTDYIPARGNPQDWGDSRANRSDRFLACVAYLDGQRPSVVMCRGYYTRTVLTAFDWDGNTLQQRWTFDSYQPQWKDYSGQGNHNLRVGDIDSDGCDEIIYGSCTIDHDGSGLYTTGLGHGDALHMTPFYPDSATLQVWACHENKRDGSTLRDARTGRIIHRYPSATDVGRCMAADIDPRHPGVEMWSRSTGGIRNLAGEITATQVKGLSTNMAVWWDGDLLRELLDDARVSKYVWEADTCIALMHFDDCAHNNGTKSNPCLHADILGDWREEVLVRTRDNKALRLYVSTLPTAYRLHTFLHDPIYRISIATQNVAYNQPTHTGFYVGSDVKGEFRGTYIH